MKVLPYITLLVLISCVSNPVAKRDIYIEAINWRFSLPYGMTFKDSSFDANGKLSKQLSSGDRSLKLFHIRESSLDGFRVHLRRDTLTDREWIQWQENDTKNVFRDIKQLPGMQYVDTKYSKTTIGSAPFMVQFVKYVTDGMQDTAFSYQYVSRIKGISVTVNIWYSDTLTGRKYLDIFYRSRFGQ